MKRTTIPRKILAILTSDWHLREDVPVCRTDDFIKAQWEKVQYIKKLQEKYSCVIIHAGDLFHHWKPSPALLTETMRNLPKDFHTVYGNHDLPQHNLELADKSGVTTLAEAGFLTLLPGGHWKTQPAVLVYPVSELKLAVTHTMTWFKELPFPGCTSPDAYRLLRKYPDIDLIVTGDNHQSFAVKKDNQWLVNPGSLTRQTANQINHAPAVYLWDGEDVFPEYLPAAPEVVSREHLDRIEKRDARLEAFINSLSDEWEVAISFEENLRRFFEKNKIRQSVQEIIYKVLD